MEHELSQTQSPFATDPIGRLIVKFAVSSVIALLVNSLYNIVDQIFIGNGVGYLGNGATNIVFPITIIALALAMMIGNGGAAYLSLKLGEGNVNSAKKRNRQRRDHGDRGQYRLGCRISALHQSNPYAVRRHRYTAPLCAGLVVSPCVVIRRLPASRRGSGQRDFEEACRAEVRPPAAASALR